MPLSKAVARAWNPTPLNHRAWIQPPKQEYEEEREQVEDEVNRRRAHAEVRPFFVCLCVCVCVCVFVCACVANNTFGSTLQVLLKLSGRRIRDSALSPKR